MSQAEEICDSVTVLNRGQVAFAGSLDRMRAEAPDPAWRLQTSDDPAAWALSRRVQDVKASLSDDGGLRVFARQEQLDHYVVGSDEPASRFGVLSWM